MKKTSPTRIEIRVFGKVVVRLRGHQTRILIRGTQTRSLGALVGLTALLLTFGPTPACAAPPAGYTLAWGEDFFQPPGAAPNPDRWKYDLGGNGWGNQELETYVDDRQHSCIVADPACTDGRALQITATSEGAGGYKSARLNTAGKAAFRYGYIEARLKVPAGKGLWPAFWMLGDDIGKVGWPGCGEIDILENLGREPSVAHGTLHVPGPSGDVSLSASTTLPGDRPLADDYHLFALHWLPGSITFLLDGVPYATRTSAEMKPGQRWVFDHPFFFVLNVAVGGGWPGPPDAATIFPQTMRVDYVRVYQRPADTVRKSALSNGTDHPGF